MINFPGATGTAAAGMNTAGRHRRRLAGRDRIPWLPAPGRRVHPYQFSARHRHDCFRINDTGEIAGHYTDAAGNTHGLIYSGGAFSTVDVAGANSTQLSTHQ